MTVRLVRAYGGYAAGATYDGTADEEVDLVAKGNAVWDTRGATAGGGPGNTQGAISTYTADQLTALAAAGGLTPYATYVASDTGVAGFASDASTLNPGINADGDIESPTGALYTLSEVTEYVTLTATGSALAGPCELAGWYCSVAAGNITIYDALSATGTPIVPATALVAGPMPIFGAGTNGKLRLTTGCWVVLSGAATVQMLVQGD